MSCIEIKMATLNDMYFIIYNELLDYDKPSKIIRHININIRKYFLFI